MTDNIELWARPEDTVPVDDHHLLRVHSAVVAERMADVLDGCSISVAAGREREFCRIVGCCHDFGKATEWFQRMVRGEDNLRGDPLTYHSLLGALLCCYTLEKQGFGPVGQALGTIVVMAHHSSMPDPTNRVKKNIQLPRTPGQRTPLTETYERIDEQLANIVECVPDQAGQLVSRATGGKGSLAEFQRFVADRGPVRALAQSSLATPGGVSAEFYADILLCYSGLKIADTSHSAGVVDADLLDGQLLSRARLEAHLDGFDNRDGVRGELDALRTHAQDTVIGRIGPGMSPVCSLWLPTGFGKTLAGLRAALEIADQFDKDRIVYALPFTSIIDQVGEEIEDVFGVTPGSPEFVIHHYLSDGAKAVRRRSTTQPVDSSIEFLLGGSWRAGCVLTTFVQVVESILAPTGSQAPKVPAIRDSVIILDEPQELPPRLWPLLARMIEILTDRFDAHVIMMTATQPRFFEFYLDRPVTDLIDDPTPYVEFLRDHPRVRYRLHGSAQRYVDASDGECEQVHPLTHSEAAVEIIDEIEGGARSTLAVCNTVESSRELFHDVRSELQSDGFQLISPARVFDEIIRRTDSVPSPASVLDAIQTEIASKTSPVIVLNLTARHRPPDRRVLIDVLAELLDPVDVDVPIIVTSTRMIEAGVDIGVDRVYRDIAQITSIVQSGGRCNREFGSGDGGVVTIWRLGTPDERTPASYIYGSGASGEGGMAQTRAALRGRGRGRGRGSEIDEGTMITDVVKEFFAAMRSYGHGDEDLVSAVDRADVDSLQSVRLIDEQPWQADTIVTRTTGERELVEALSEQLSKPPNERDRAETQRLLSDISTLRFAVPDPTDDSGSLSPESGFRRVSNDGLLWLDTIAAEFDPEVGVI